MAEERFQSLLQSTDRIAPAREFIDGANVPDYEAEYQKAAADLDAYWDAAARELEWFKPWDKVLEWDYPNARYFVGGQCNITVSCLDRHVRERPTKAALIWLGENGEERIFDFQQLAALVFRIANGLKALGVRKGDRVGIYLPLTPEGMAAMLACARIGAIHSVTYAGLGAGALRSRLADAEATVLLTADVGYRRGKTVDLLGIADEALTNEGGVPSLQHVVIWHREPGGRALGARELDWDEWLRDQPSECAPEVMDSEDPLFLLYTSGTTGLPKAPVYVHGGYMVGTHHYCQMAYDLKDSDIYWCTSDIGWIVGHSSMVYGPWANGTTIVVREGAPDYPDPGIVWQIIERHQVTKLFTAPTTLRMFMRFGEEWPSQHNLSSLRILICAGEPLNPEALIWAYRHIMSETGPVCDNWWQTETAAPTIGTLPSMVAKPGRAGKALPGYDAAVVDREGNPRRPNEGGFLVLRGPWPQMMRTIWKDHARYEQYWHTIPGVYTAGDVATVDEDGYIMVLGRADDVLNVAGHRIGTADVESALVGHPAVAEAGVIGKPDPIKGEAIKAFVILRAGNQPSDSLRAELVTRVRHELGPIATPNELEFVPKLPKTRSGKIMRRVLKAQELGLDPGDLTTIEE